MGFGSFYSAISGLRGHLFSMSVIGNNIANSNTPGYKSNRTTFREALVQTLRGASAPRQNLGGQNALQVGLGTEIGSVDTNRTQGVLQNTGIVTDLAIDGDGYFVVASGADQFYTRAGTFVFDRDGQLVSRGTGHIVQGWLADADGQIPTGAPLSPLQLPLDLRIPGQATTSVSLKANLDAAATESVASLSSAGTTGITFVGGSARNGAGGQHALTVTGQNATASRAAGANLSLPGALTGAESLGSLGVTDPSGFSLRVDGGTAIAVTGLTATSTVSDLVLAINTLGAGIQASIANGEVVLQRAFHGDGSVYNVETSAGAAGNIARQIFGAPVAGTFRVANGTASTLAANNVFTPTGGQPLAPIAVNITYDPVTGLATGLEDLGQGGVTITARDGLAAGTVVIDTKPTDHLTSLLVYDSLGNTHALNVTFTKGVTPNTWTWSAGFDGGETITGGGGGQVVFNSDGSIQSWTYDGGTDAMTLSPGPGTEPMTLRFETGTPAGFDGLTQFASAFTARASSQDGFATGSLSSISIDQSGVIAGHFSNQVLRTLGQIVLARFNNPEGLERVSGGMYQASLNTTDAVIGAAGSTVPSTIQAGALEGSNVDLSEEFVSMIVAQRGFQANARVITTGDQLMADLINLKQ